MKPIIIEGVPRSGTRFFCDFIEKQFDIIIFRVQSIVRKYHECLFKHNKYKDDQIIKNFLFDIQKDFIIRERIGNIDSFCALYNQKNFHTFLYDLLYLKANEKGFSYWGLKFDNPSGMEICNNLFYGCKFIHIIRDGRDVHLSASKCLDEGFYTSYNNAIFWQNLLKTRRNFGSSLGKERYLEIKYESLLQNPELMTIKIGKFIGKSVTNYKTIPINSSNFNKWQSSMSKRSIRIYEAIAGNTLNIYGYDVSSLKPKITTTDRILSGILEIPLKFNRYLLNLFSRKGRKNIIRMLRILKTRYL